MFVYDYIVDGQINCVFVVMLFEFICCVFKVLWMFQWFRYIDDFVCVCDVIGGVFVWCFFFVFVDGQDRFGDVIWMVGGIVFVVCILGLYIDVFEGIKVDIFWVIDGFGNG